MAACDAAGGTLLARATFTSESGSGWQSVNFDQPVPIQAGTTYVASYFAPNGHYSVTGSGFASAIDNASLHSIANTVSPNGVYAYTGAPSFPPDSYNASNYWVDVLFLPTAAPGAATGVDGHGGQGLGQRSPGRRRRAAARRPRTRLRRTSARPHRPPRP